MQGRKADLVVVQLDLRYAAGGRDSAVQRAQTEEAVAGYVAAAKAAGARLVFCVLPASQHVTHKRSKAEPQPVKKTEGDYEQELKAVDAECLRLARMHDAVMAPIPQAYAQLRKAKPDMDIHPPISNTDSHPSPRDSYLFAYAVATRLLGRKADSFPSAATVFAAMNDRIAKENEKNKGKGDPKPLVAITTDEQMAIHEAVSKAIETFDAELSRLPVPGGVK